MATTINVPDAAPAGVAVSVEPVVTLNGGAITPARHIQRIVLSVCTAAGVVLDILGSTAWGLLVEVSRIKPATTATTTKVVATAITGTPADLFVANANHKGRRIFNDTPTSRLLVKEGAGADLDDFGFYVYPGEVWEMPAESMYGGLMTGIWEATDVGKARCTEFT